ncbi:MAG TPA: hypothetical protein VG123_32935, partial [Streptosporangiaceae bacterium]|nr:hypothetical protein [Streptosporangiaceae bacterium]
AAGSRPASAATAPGMADGTAGGPGRFRRLWGHSGVKVSVLTVAAALEVAYLQAHGYSQVFADDGYVVLHRPADSRTAQAHPLPAPRLHTNICY